MRRTIAVLLCAGLVLGAEPANAGGSHQRLGVPAYWEPGDARFDALAGGAPTVGIVVVNGPASHAPTPFDPAVAAHIRRLYHEGITVLGYVDTGYLGRTGMVTTRVNPGSTAAADWHAQANLDAAEWFTLYGRYGLEGIFFDQTLSGCGTDGADVDVYHAIADTLRTRVRDAFVALNPGTGAEECYAEVADALVVFENTYATYLAWTPPDWVHRHRARQFWHLVYAAASVDDLRSAVALSRERNAGFVYVTDDTVDATGSPWDTLPSYWREEVRCA